MLMVEVSYFSPLRGHVFDIEEFLRQEQAKDLLRFTTAGSVDDGKSTLIGRLLHDVRGAYEDQFQQAIRGGEKVTATVPDKEEEPK